MIQAQFISSWWHWLQVFNWKGGNEDPNRKVVLGENKWHYVVILLKRNKTKTSLNTWGFQQKKKENEKPNVWTSVSFEPVGSANKRTRWQYQIQFLFQRYLCKRKTSTIHDDECRCTEVQMTFLWKINRKRGTDLTKKSSKMSDYQQQDMKFEWVKIENSRCCQKCISPCEVLPLCHFHPVIKWCKYFCHACKY